MDADSKATTYTQPKYRCRLMTGDGHPFYAVCVSKFTDSGYRGVGCLGKVPKEIAEEIARDLEGIKVTLDKHGVRP